MAATSSARRTASDRDADPRAYAVVSWLGKGKFRSALAPGTRRQGRVPQAADLR